MKTNYIISLLFSLVSISGQSQTITDTSEKDFLHSIFKNTTSSVLYVKSTLDTFEIGEIVRQLRNGQYKMTVHLEDKKTRVDSLNLTSIEISEILNSLSDDKKWLAEHYPNCVIVPSDSIEFVFRQKDPFTTLHKLYGWTLYSLTRPVFLRDKSLCFFYFDYVCDPLCGGTRCAIYKREGNKWKVFWRLIMMNS